jgi:hypothetical protein
MKQDKENKQDKRYIFLHTGYDFHEDGSIRADYVATIVNEKSLDNFIKCWHKNEPADIEYFYEEFKKKEKIKKRKLTLKEKINILREIYSTDMFIIEEKNYL